MVIRTTEHCLAAQRGRSGIEEALRRPHDGTTACATFSFCLAVAALGLAAIGCQKESSVPNSSPSVTSQPKPDAGADKSRFAAGMKFSRPIVDETNTESPPLSCSRFVDVAEAIGLSHVYLNGAAGQALMPEATGGGCGWVDYDRDGQLDLYLNQGGDLATAVSDSTLADQLFRNMGSGSFAPVAAAAGISECGYSQGVAIGDYDNDGFDDIYITNVGGNRLYRNSGDGTFFDVTIEASVAGGLWSTSAAWADLDLDGDLDLYVCNYVEYDPHSPRVCQNALGRPAMCHPNQMEAVPDECYLNLGDGSFRAVAAERGLFGPGNKALGVAVADFNNDGWPDIFVANDTTPNFLFLNDGKGHFRESAVMQGCAVNTNGNAQANMGIAVGDYDRNGWLDLYITHFTQEWNTLYRNRGTEGFQDVSALVGLVPLQLDKLGFGTIMADFNYDGNDELFVANGHVHDDRDMGNDFEMVSQLFAWNGKRWHDCTQEAGDFFERRVLARGVASGDYDNDGDIDLIVACQNTPAALLNNHSELGNWLKLEFVGRQCNRRGIGTRIVVKLGDRRLLQELAGGTSYCASNQPALFVGLGDWSSAVDLEVRWPGGAVQSLHDVLPNQAYQLFEPSVRGTDEAAGPASNVPKSGVTGSMNGNDQAWPGRILRTQTVRAK